MPVDTVNELLRVLGQCKALEPAQNDRLAREAARFSEPRDLGRALIQRSWLTPFQVNLILQDRAAELLLGSYVLLDRLGEGGMGQVFKARNWKLGQVVALKVIRKDKLNNAEAVRRFHREMKAVAQLSHPNIVRALDADEVNGLHFFAMELVEGTDLSKLLKQSGRLPVEQACDFVRQAAQGLQHAAERGLVHRDIKPGNLFLVRSPRETIRDADSATLVGQTRSPYGRIKIFDMGLARMDDGDNASDGLTREGILLGTADYVAPEQAINPHTADSRADLYSLGCTFYHLLTGQVPFPGGTLMEKLVRHRESQPEPVEKLRPEVPPAVAKIVRRLVAKRPEDRYQTPAELVSALETAALAPAGDTMIVRGRRALRERRWAVAAAAAAFLFLVVLVFAFRSGGKEPLASNKGSTISPTRPGVQPTTPATKPQPAAVALQILCGKGRRGQLEEAIKLPGYGYRLLQGQNYDNWPATSSRTYCWYAKDTVRFEVTMPTGTAGTLRLHFVEGFNRTVRQRLVVESVTIGEYEDFGQVGKYVEVPIYAADTADGRIEVALQRLPGNQAYVVVSLVEFTPEVKP